MKKMLLFLMLAAAAALLLTGCASSADTLPSPTPGTGSVTIQPLIPDMNSQNMQAFRYALSLAGKPAVWAAWGNIIEARPYLVSCVQDMIKASIPYDAAWYCCGKMSKRGHPHHPLYLRKDEPLVDFDAQTYLSLLKEKK